jgi:nucleoside-diphosphate-sugar epimerase
LIVAVTGAEGFIGSGLVPVLSASGHSVRPLVHIGKGRLSTQEKAGEVDIATGEGLEGAFRGADVVIHLAARNIRRNGSSTRLADEYRQVNVEGTRNVVRAARTAGVRLIIHASSTKAMGEESGTTLDEDSPCMPRTPYGVSKLESERVVTEEAAGSAMGAVILRLPQVYGAGVGGKFLRMLRWADRGRPFPIIRPERPRSILYLGNLAAAVVALLESPVSPFSIYLLKDREDVSFRTLYSAICAGFGKTPRFIKVPSIGVWFGMILSEYVRNIAGSFQVSSAKFEREVGFSPPHSLEQAISETVERYRRSVR